ncbi:hypothetical protein L226DRAFT_550158 [Lentinus tigrinus ALCF2SS1-7]|uniref:Enhancer of mRNA-decapping protein 4 WD40 repeat region domain-containing protein n=1 Tax=Lentinus tigrinus ALCF2SS1-6 TaxID=1328759 RepID=A0A5C2SSF9_9APHY|nr:hypothetical protein L227DRAFT_648796 [Lentinus tigrinus ALCF2SS1-6]RPD79935.1 hypothetical protein L226DRAFT_550158 [Lentinus tigrinus ALCF2SS1-7]
MDPIASRDNVFSRGPSTPPPASGAFSQVLPAQSNEPHVSPVPSQREPVSSTAQSQLDSLFHGLNAPSASHASPQPSITGPSIYHGPQEQPHSGPATPASGHAGSVSSNVSGPSNQSTERQNALLSLLGAVASPSSNPQPIPPVGPVQPQQVPTPPGSAPRPGMSTSESQGKLLLEQLMSGHSAPSFSPQSEPQQPPMSLPPLGPQPYPPVPEQPHHDEYSLPPEVYPHEREGSVGSLAPQDSQQRAPSPARRSMFDFVSPFDALNNTNTGAKRKPPPPAQPSEEPSSWNPVAVDPKRKSVENLMDQLTRGQAPQPQPTQPPVAPYEPYQMEEHPQQEPVQARGTRPLPPQPVHPTGSPRASPPKQASQPARQQRRAADSPIGPPGAPQGPFGNNYHRDKESSPLPQRGGYEAKRSGPKGKNASPTVQSQTVIFDVSQPLDEIQAPQDAVKSTAIALVKVDSTFLPGTTIGATQWVAYAMTKGRVRVISRSSGDRTLLTLPPLFPPTTAVSDMSVHGNRLAGVTSDGGFVVWELPEVITDDVPGQVMLCVYPQNDMDPLHAVKWHPQQPDLVAVASETNVYLLNIADAAHAFGGEPISQSELHRVGQIFSVPSPIIAFDYDVPRQALATISEDSSLTMWNIRDKLPFWSHKIRGDERPSSLTFVDGGVIVGRKNGTIFQLLPVMGRQVLSTIKFVRGDQEDPHMFGHANYDRRIQTLWIANNRRESMIAFKLNFDVGAPSPGGDDASRGPYFDQVVEFSGPKPTIHFVILTADADPHGDEAHAACVAAKVPPGELALVAFSVHSTGVDQVLIRKEWYNTAFNSAQARFPSYHAPQLPPQRQQQPIPASHPYNQPAVGASPVNVPLPRAKTPPSEEVEAEPSNQDGGRREPRGKNAKGKNVGWKENNKDSERENANRKPDINSDGELSAALTKEIKKSEESLHTRLGRLITKELDKQHQRLEEVRQSEQAADFVRQEKILKLISTELTKNTTRVVEMAVKAEVQNSVLPSLENITKQEVKAALSNQIAKGVSEAMKVNLPNEIERVLIRPEMANQIARAFSTSVTPVIERQVKESISKNLIPSSAMHQELSREIRSEILNLKKEVLAWQSDALRGQESVIRDLEQSVRVLSDQIKYLMNHPSPSSFGHMQNRSSPGPSSAGLVPSQQLSQLLARQPNMAPLNQPSGYQPHASFQQPPPQPQQAPAMHGPWFGPNIAAPQASHPTAPPPIPQQQALPRATPPASGQSEEWDDAYLAVLGSQDIRQLRELLSRSNPEIVMPLNAPTPLSQAVMLTLVHRLSTIIGETSPVDESFKLSMWWLQRAATALNTTDPLISPYVARVMPNVQQMLNTTKQRLAILPGPPIEATRAISDIQDILNRKPI